MQRVHLVCFPAAVTGWFILGWYRHIWVEAPPPPPGRGRSLSKGKIPFSRVASRRQCGRLHVQMEVSASEYRLTGSQHAGLRWNQTSSYYGGVGTFHGDADARTDLVTARRSSAERGWWFVPAQAGTLRQKVKSIIRVPYRSMSQLAAGWERCVWDVGGSKLRLRIPAQAKCSRRLGEVNCLFISLPDASAKVRQLINDLNL